MFYDFTIHENYYSLEKMFALIYHLRIQTINPLYLKLTFNQLIS